MIREKMYDIPCPVSLVLYFAPEPQLFLIVYLQLAFYDNQVLTRRVGFFHSNDTKTRRSVFQRWCVVREKSAVFPRGLINDIFSVT